MKNWKQAKADYLNDHLSKELANHPIRLNAFKRIESVFAEKFPKPLKDHSVFDNITKPYMMKLYECLKGYALNGAERSIFNGLYKFSK
jgi:hypothetical protein